MQNVWMWKKVLDPSCQSEASKDIGVNVLGVIYLPVIMCLYVEIGIGATKLKVVPGCPYNEHYCIVSLNVKN